MRIFWSEPAIEQLEEVRELHLRRAIFRAVMGLVQFPKKGPRPPELSLYPELDSPHPLRELIFPGLCRLFYRLDEKKGIVRVVGIAFRGQDVSRSWLEEAMRGLGTGRE